MSDEDMLSVLYLIILMNSTEKRHPQKGKFRFILL
jgi:hypothetical protein